MLSVWCVFRIIYITCMVHFIPNITVVFTAYPVTWLLSSLIFLFILSKGRWMETHL